MTAITCKLDCGHSIQWGDTPETPGADLPWEGRSAYCTDCEADREITECDPDVVDIRNVEVDPATNKGGVGVKFYTRPQGFMYSYCTYATVQGIYSESEDFGGYASADEAEAAGRAAYAENQRYSTDLSQNDINTVEHYDQLTPAERAEYRDNTPWSDFADNPAAVEAEFNRIDRGLKANCLS